MTPLLGVHLRGTDKVTHPKIPIQRFFKPIDAYLQAYPNAKILLCSDDASYHARMRKRYGEEKLVSASTGYSTDNIVRDPSIDRYQKGRSGLLDALLLAHTDFLLKGTSSLSEFALWYNPSLIERHMDLQIEGDGAESATYKSLIPKWMGGPYEPAPLTAEQQPAAMLAKLAAGTSAAGRPAERLEATAVQQSIDQAAASVEQGGGGFGGRRARRRKRNVMAPNTRRQQRRQLKKALTIKEVAGDEWAKVSKVPEWPLPATSPQDIAVAADPGAHAELAAAIRYTQIKSGSCSGERAEAAVHGRVRDTGGAAVLSLYWPHVGAQRVPGLRAVGAESRRVQQPRRREDGMRRRRQEREAALVPLWSAEVVQ